MTIWIKGIVRGLYAIPIFLLRVYISVIVVPIGFIVCLGDWAHNDKFQLSDWTDGLKQLWGMDNVG